MSLYYVIIHYLNNMRKFKMDDFIERVFAMFVGLLALFFAVGMVGAVMGFLEGLFT